MARSPRHYCRGLLSLQEYPRPIRAAHTILPANQTVPLLPRHSLRCRAAVLIAALSAIGSVWDITAIPQGLPRAVRRITRKNRHDSGGKPIEVSISPTFTAPKRLRAPAATRPALRSPSVREYAFGPPFGGFAAATHRFS